MAIYPLPSRFIRLTVAIAMLAIGLVALSPQASHAAARDAQREDARKAVARTLERLYKLQPRAKSAVENAAGYAVFTNVGMKLLVAGGGKGKGIAVDNRTQRETFMKMVEMQAGLGFGIKKFRLVFVFENESAFDGFVNAGWELGTQATAAAQFAGQGAWAAGAVSVSPGIWLYQLTDDGVALEITAKGTKYYKDDALN
jgi:lipid-binding SYLF domain-containing protein